MIRSFDLPEVSSIIDDDPQLSINSSCGSDQGCLYCCTHRSFGLIVSALNFLIPTYQVRSSPETFLLGTAAYKANPHIYTATNYSSRIFRLSDDMSDIERERNYPILWYDEVSSTMDKVITADSVHHPPPLVCQYCNRSHRHAICAQYDGMPFLL